MNVVQRLGLALLGKSADSALLALHPELATRQHMGSDWDSTMSGDSATGLHIYAEHVWVNKAINVLADNMAAVPLQVIDAQGEAVENHPALVALEHNPAMPSSELWRLWTIRMMLDGEIGFEWVKTRGGQWSEVWPRESATIGVLASKGARYGAVIGYRLDDHRGAPYTCPPEEFLFFKFYNPEQPLRGLTPISACRMSVRLDTYAQQWTLKLAQRGGIPPYAIITPQGITKSERLALEAEFSSKLQGVENAQKPAILEQGVTDIKPLGSSLKDAEWVKQREMSREEIGAIFGVPDEIMGWGRDTYENFSQALRVLWAIRLEPLCNQRDIALTEWLYHNGSLAAGLSVRTDLSGIDALQDDNTAKITSGVQMWQTGVPWQQIDDLLDLGLGDFPGKDQGYLSAMVVPAGAPVPTPPPATSPAKAVVKAFTIERDSPAHKAIWLLFKGATEGRERALERIIKARLEREKRELLDRIRAATEGNMPSADELLSVQDSARAMLKTTGGYWRDTVLAGALYMAEQISAMLNRPGAPQVAFAITGDIATAIDAMIWDFTKEVGQFTQDMLRTVLTQGADEGWSVDEIAQNIGDLYDGWSGARAPRIARTETIKAFNYGCEQQGIAEGMSNKRWISALDERTRQPPESDFDHWAAHGETVPILDPFTNTGEDLDFPGAPGGSPGNVINCRCTLVTLPEGEAS